MAKYINTAKNEFYDLTDPNAPKLIGNMTDFANQQAEQNFQAWKQQMSQPGAMGAANAEAEKAHFIQRESGKIYQELLGQTEFRENLTPTAPAPESPYRPSTDFSGLPPIQTAQMPTGYNGEPTFKAAAAPVGTGALNAPQVAQPGQTAPYFYGADVLGKKANDAAVNTLYRAYFGRDASAAELKNWGAAGGADTTVKSLEDFLKSEQIKYNVPQGTNSLTPESFKPTAAVTLPTENLTDNANTSDAVIASTPAITKSFQDYVNEITLPLTETQKKEQTLEDMMASLTGQAAKRGEEQLSAEQAAGISILKENVNNIISQIEAKKLEYEAYKQAQMGKPITLQSITGSIAQKQSQIASDILLLQAQGMMYQGKLDTAQATVDRAIDLKYQTLDNQYKIYAAQLEALRPQLTREENIRADAMKAMMADRQQALNNRKAKEKAVEKAKLDKIDMENKLVKAGYIYVDTPAKRDNLRAQGYDILEQTDNNGVKRTYAKKPEVKATSRGKTPTPKGSTPEEEMNAQLSAVVGADGFISPDNYLIARNAWIKEGLSPTIFDTKFKGFRNPNNPYYITEKEKKSNSGDRTP